MFLWLTMALAGRLDLNQATVAELETLRAIGPSKAASIVAWREARGPCSDPEELLDAPGIGLGTWYAVRGAVMCGDGALPESVVLHEPPPSRRPSPVNINRASAAELLALAGMTPERAALLVSDREARGTFASCRDVRRIPGFGVATVATWGDRCVVDDVPADAPAADAPG